MQACFGPYGRQDHWIDLRRSPERDSAHRKLAAIPDWPGWGAVEEQAVEVFWGPFIDLREGELDEARRVMSQSTFKFWLFFDHRNDDGRRLADAFLETGPPLSVGERAYLEAVRSTVMRLYEVVEVRPGASLALREVSSGAEAP